MLLCHIIELLAIGVSSRYGKREIGVLREGIAWFYLALIHTRRGGSKGNIFDTMSCLLTEVSTNQLNTGEGKEIPWITRAHD